MIDLHTHSTVSDGSDTPEALVDLAVKAGLSALALTDHDRQDGVLPARKRAHAAGIELVAGAEISCQHSGTMHLLVYFLEPGEGPLQDELLRLQAARDTRNERLVARLAKGRPAYLEKERLEPVTAVELSLESGALPVLAHPLSLGLVPGELERTVRELAEAGLAGLEAIYGRYSREERAELAVMAAQAGLAITGGSDHHGSYKPDLSVGVGRGDLHVPDGALAALRDRLLD